MRFRFIEDHRTAFPVRVLCAVLEVSASGYYAWRGRPESARAMADRGLAADIRRVHADNRSVYGSPRVHEALRAEGRRVGVNRVARLMRRHGIQGRRKRRAPRTTDSKHALPIAPNLLVRRFTAAAPNRVRGVRVPARARPTQRGHWKPTEAGVMHSGQMGRPHRAQEMRVGRSGCR